MPRSGMVQERSFSGNTRDFSADPDRSRVGAGLRESLVAALGASVRREPGVPQKFQPASVRLTRQQLRRTLADSSGVFTAQVPAVVQEELKQRQVVLPQLLPQEEEVAQPAVDVGNRHHRSSGGPEPASEERWRCFHVTPLSAG